MKSARPYRPALSKEIVLEHILEGAGSAFDPELVEPFHDLITSGWTFDSPGRANVR